MSFTADLQHLEPGALVQLIEVDGTEFGMPDVLRFHAYNITDPDWQSFTTGNLPSVIWQGEEYDPHPYELTNLAVTSEGAQATPTLSVGNVGNFVAALCLEYDDLVKAKVRIHITFKKYLDAANWKGGNSAANPNESRKQLFYINSKTSETRAQVDFELCSPFNIQSLQLPSRQITPGCTWCMRGWYRSGTGCDYAGEKYFTKDGVSTDDPSKDVCGGYLSDCKLRFGTDSPLPFGGFPGANLQGK
ncbi:MULTISPECIES: phage minor tail protein L [unclassified Tatumella]|uniref:Phage minor tail protein L n=1 Tax=Tatumella punctata TaxID=399969 RepID=A0ABW1VTL6_9GAMM|nr:MULTISPECIES: phage minor tail protein L [unclassified Tatumella]MBS0855995.1 phage minor tail protein L [Tatumella sp. JGM16]MBS0878601.1 phage minor tail protein L [Tatumella sp. JGM82]MBS0892177.1 phage minor tail protein L [Tatumella sp. JGM94]MBS0903307.1 phage minor tail protein L [Tatumella sp. JGM100]MBS0912974.1 phage minor tail protein L [Tatumella sp. JGM91]